MVLNERFEFSVFIKFEVLSRTGLKYSPRNRIFQPEGWLGFICKIQDL